MTYYQFMVLYLTSASPSSPKGSEATLLGCSCFSSAYPSWCCSSASSYFGGETRSTPGCIEVEVASAVVVAIFAAEGRLGADGGEQYSGAQWIERWEAESEKRKRKRGREEEKSESLRN